MQAGWHNPTLPSTTVIDGIHLVLSFEELQEHVFDPIIRNIITLIDHQVQYLRNKGWMNPVCDKLLLIGGFGENEYLYQKLRMSFQDTSIILSIDKVATASMAIVRGKFQLFLPKPPKKHCLV